MARPWRAQVLQASWSGHGTQGRVSHPLSRSRVLLLVLGVKGALPGVGSVVERRMALNQRPRGLLTSRGARRETASRWGRGPRVRRRGRDSGAYRPRSWRGPCVLLVARHSGPRARVLTASLPAGTLVPASLQGVRRDGTCWGTVGASESRYRSRPSADQALASACLT